MSMKIFWNVNNRKKTGGVRGRGENFHESYRLYDKKDSLSCDLSKDLESWTDELFDELKDAIK